MFPPFLTTGIGSMPNKDAGDACRLVLETFDIPFWPQLPQLSFHELMIPQFSEGLPFLKIDEEKKKIWLEKDGSDALTQFYETCTDDCKIAISGEYAKGLYAFRKAIRDKHFMFLKGQVTGPLTFTLGLKDREGKLVYFDEELREICLLLLKAKVRWQSEMLRPYAEKIIIFIDEPILSALGTSSYIGVDSEEALRLLRETADVIRQEGGIPGIHCCGKADWPLVIKSNVTVISFDAYDYIETISLYPLEFTDFLRSGGYLAWGIVPTTDFIREEDTASLKRRFDKGLETLAKSMPADLLLSNILLTPSCGTGSRSEEETAKVFRSIAELKKLLTGVIR
jgi:hypothetical protein